MNIRRATEDDFDAIAELEQYVYSLPPDYTEMSRKRFQYTFEDYLLLEDKGIAIASARLIPLQQNIRGLWKKMGAVAMVTSYPETRRRGHVRQLMNHMYQTMHEEGYASSMLYPFKDTFYAAFGYVNCPPRMRVVANPIHLSRWKLPEGYCVLRMPMDDAADHYKKLFKETGVSTHGATARSEKRWNELTANSRIKTAVVFGSSDEAEGVMLYQHKGYSDFMGEDSVGSMNVREWHWKNHYARSALMNFIYLHTDQIVKASFPANPSIDDYYQWIEGRNILELKTGLTYMARCIDVQIALEGLPARSDGQLTFRVTDPDCEWNNQTYWVDASGGNMKVEPIGDADTNITLTIKGLSALLYGTLSADELVPYGWISGAVPGLLGDWFPRKYIWMYEDF
ncbi:MAG: GNAT family N-acetyltransferase [Candidatus Thorarchaeota archaeon]|jgi:predicted acetyltransferase